MRGFYSNAGTRVRHVAQTRKRHKATARADGTRRRATAPVCPPKQRRMLDKRGRERYSLVVLRRGGFRVDVRGWRCSRRSFSRSRRRRRRLRGQRRTSAVGAGARAGADAEGSLMVGHCRPAESSRPLPCDADRCWERSSRRNHVMLDGLRAAGRGAAELSGWLFNSLWTAVLDVCQRLQWFSLVDAVDATFDEGLASWASVGCGAGLYKRRKVKRVVTSKGWDRSSPRAGLAGLNTFAQLALGGVRSEGVGGGSVCIQVQVQVASRNRGRLGGRKRTGTRNVAQFRANVFLLSRLQSALVGSADDGCPSKKAHHPSVYGNLAL